MSDQRGHPSDELQLLLDGRLPPPLRQEVEAHLGGCSRCQGELAVLQRVRAALREQLPDQAVPAELAARVARELATATAGGERGRERLRRRVVAWGLSLAAGVLLALAGWSLVTRSDRDAVRTAARDFQAVASGRLTLELRTADPPALEQHFARAGLPFAARVFDFGMMDYRLIGGRVHRLGGERSALFAYQGGRGGAERIVCQMYEGRLESLPPPLEERERNGIRFRVYRHDDLTLVFWQEGKVVCVLVSGGDPEAAIQLAYAKAVKL